MRTDGLLSAVRHALTRSARGEGNGTPHVPAAAARLFDSQRHSSAVARAFEAMREVRVSQLRHSSGSGSSTAAHSGGAFTSPVRYVRALERSERWQQSKSLALSPKNSAAIMKRLNHRLITSGWLPYHIIITDVLQTKACNSTNAFCSNATPTPDVTLTAAAEKLFALALTAFEVRVYQLPSLAARADPHPRPVTSPQHLRSLTASSTPFVGMPRPILRTYEEISSQVLALRFGSLVACADGTAARGVGRSCCPRGGAIAPTG